MGCERWYDDVAEHDHAEHDDHSQHHPEPTEHTSLPEHRLWFEFERRVLHALEQPLRPGVG
jgi:hypothetical protein